MKRFLITFTLFCLPLLLFYVAAEFYARTATNFSVKKHYFETNQDSVELLILGSSHSQNAMNPEFFCFKTVNLAFGGQTLSIDYFLLQKYIGSMPDLKMVCLEVSPHRFYDDLSASNWNGHIYSNLYGIPYKTEPYSLKNHILVLSHIKFFSSIFIDYLNPLKQKYEINKSGFITNDFYDRFAGLKNDNVQINQSYKMLHTFDNKANLNMNAQFLRQFVQLCRGKGILVVLISPPLYNTYRSQIPLRASSETDSLLNQVSGDANVVMLDFSDDPSFSIRDFKNDNHLNSDGAKKFSLRLDSALSTLN